MVQLVDADVPFTQEIEERTGIDRAGTGVHGHAFERAESHCRVDGAPVRDRRDRAAAAEVADHESRPGAAEQLRRALRAPLDREAVEPIPADTPLFAPAQGDCVDGGLLRNRGVESGVEDSHVGQVREGLARLVDPTESRCVVERGKALELVDRPADLVVDQHRGT